NVWPRGGATAGAGGAGHRVFAMNGWNTGGGGGGVCGRPTSAGPPVATHRTAGGPWGRGARSSWHTPAPTPLASTTAAPHGVPPCVSGVYASALLYNASSRVHAFSARPSL